MRTFFIAIIFLLSLVPVAHAQNTITTVVGGVPENENALSVGLGGPYGFTRDSVGNMYIAGNGNCMIFEVNLSGQLSTIAGNGAVGYSGDGGPATNAELSSPSGVALDGSGNIFIADSGNSVIREVFAATGKIQTIVGDGIAGYSGDGGPATSAELNSPSTVFVDTFGNIFIADSNNEVIREVGGPNNSVIGPGVIRTIAGNGTQGFSGDGGPATSAAFDFPFGVFLDGSGNIFISDVLNYRIREIVAATGDIQTVAGNGVFGYNGNNIPAASASIYPVGVFVDPQGNIFFADQTAFQIREVVAATGLVQAVAGNGTYGYSGDGGPATSAELMEPFAVYVDGLGNLYFCDAFASVIREVAAATGIIQTIAGNGTASFSGDNVPATNSELATGSESGVSVDGSGNIFIADTNNFRIREAVAATGKIQTIAGNGTNGYNGDLGPATSAELDHPNGIFLDSFGNLFIADTGNFVIREFFAATGNIRTVAGNGIQGFSGDGGQATSAELGGPTNRITGGLFSFWGPEGVFVDRSGNIFIADTVNFRIREVAAATGIIQTVAGNGTPGFSGDGGPATSAELGGFIIPAINGIYGPESVFVDDAGNVYITDTQNNRIREVGGPNNTTIGPGVIQTIAGNGTPGFNGDGGPATSAELNQPGYVLVDGAGNIFIADTLNNTIREVGGPNNTTIGPGLIRTVAGNGVSGFSGDGGPAISAELNFPTSVWADLSGNLLIYDSGNARIRSVAGLTSVPSVTFSPPTLPLTTGQTGNIIVFNSGAAPLVISGMSFTGPNPGDFVFGASTTCPLNGGILAAQASCTLSIGLLPSLQTSGTASISVADNAANSPQLVQISVSTVPVVSFQPQSLTLNAVGAPQNINLTNTGAVPLLISSIALTGLNPAAFALAPATTCPITGGALAPQASCTLSVSFRASSQGTAASASLTITDNAANPTQSVPLNAATLIVESSGPFAVSRGQTLSVNLELLGPPSTVPYSLACNASPSGPIISCLPSSVTGPNQTFAVAISAATSSFAPMMPPTTKMDRWLYAFFAFLVCALWMICARLRMPVKSRIYAHITLAVLCIAALALTSCIKAGITEQASVGTVTPGAYTVTVTATPSNSSGNLTATFPLTIN